MLQLKMRRKREREETPIPMKGQKRKNSEQLTSLVFYPTLFGNTFLLGTHFKPLLLRQQPRLRQPQRQFRHQTKATTLKVTLTERTETSACILRKKNLKILVKLRLQRPKIDYLLL